MKKVFTIVFLTIAFGLKAQNEELTATTIYKWRATDEPKAFNSKLQLSFVQPKNGFPHFGTVISGGGYVKEQDGGAFQLYFPYGEYHGGNVPKIRLGQYNNKGWSKWQAFYTSANANNTNYDWKAKNLRVIGEVKIKKQWLREYSGKFLGIGNGSSGSGLYLASLAVGYNYGTLKNLGKAESRVLINGNVGIGTKTPDAKLAVNGNIHTKEVKVDLNGWADFVFDKNYNLPSLSKVEKHIQEKGHLANIPSAEEVAKKGVKLGEMNKKLLQKIEELTLYTIQQQKDIEKLKKLVHNQSKMINQLKK